MNAHTPLRKISSRGWHPLGQRRGRAKRVPAQGAMLRVDPERNSETAWTEPDRFEVKAKG
jgi:hypothetical protein